MTLFSDLFAYEFMRNAFAAGTIAAIVAAIVGYFVVLRGQTFAGHALSHIGFAGAAGAGLVGILPATGQLLLSLLASIGMGSLGEKAAKSDIAIGITLAFSLGLGVLFLYFYTNYAGHATVILFGDLFGVSTKTIQSMLIYSLISLLGVALLGKRLLFASLEPELAQAKGISLRFLSIWFFMLVSIAVTEASQVVGILLVFTLLIGPPASALSCTRKFWKGLGLSVLIGVIMVWLGIILSYITNWPVSFWISALVLVGYLGFKNLSMFWS
ncbi:MAG TPA: metal ABC transporter permease [Gammaproteobacteria bacterium]|nr:metal ABC transporter permease [Gammaproteobacteria bacterium]